MKKSILNSVWLGRGLSFALFLSASLYAIALIAALSHAGCCLIYQTEQLQEQISFTKHKWIGIAAYTFLCCTLAAAALTLAKKQMAVALGLLLVAITMVVNDTAGALYDSFMAMPWVPDRGPAFEAFFNIERIPLKVWYVILCALVLSTAFSAAHTVSDRRKSVADT